MQSTRPQRRPEQTRLIGLVVDEPGRPVAGTVVRLIGGTDVFTTTCGPDGSFTLIVDQPALHRRVPISGRVIGIDGRPAQGILLTIAGRPLSNGSFLTSGTNARTRADGTFRFNERPEMSSMIAVVDERWAAVSKSGIENHEGQPVEGVELRLVPGTVIRGRTTVGPEQRPVVGQEVVLSEQGPVVNGRARVELTRRAMTDSEGHYQLRAAPGEYLLFVPPLIGSSGVFQIGTEPEIVRDFHVENAPVLQLTGLVVRVGPAGEPVAGAIVEGQPYDTDSGLSRFSSVADVRGRFRAERYRDKMLVAARSRDGALAGLGFIGADDDNVRIAISTAATISGRMIYPDGKPVAEQSVSCLISVDPPDHVVVQGRTPTVIRRALTDAEGRFTFAGIPVGSRCRLAASMKIGEKLYEGSLDTGRATLVPKPVADLILTQISPAIGSPR